MSEPPTTDAAIPAPRKPAKRRAAPPKQAAPDEFAGLTARDCCEGCSEKRCVITQTAFCGHPFKSSHSGAAPAVFARIARAKKRLAHQKIEAV